MTIDIDESNPDELWIIRQGSKLQSIFFAIMGFLFQVLFVWAYWSFLDASGPWAFFWLGLINSEFFPLTSLLFLFGGGCFLVAIKEAFWIECWIIKRELSLKTPGIQKQWQLFSWSRTKTISKDTFESVLSNNKDFDKYVSENTKFESLADMQKTTISEYQGSD